MKLIVGLGNPGRKYEGTRHNIGFAVVDGIAKRYSLDRLRSNFKGEFGAIVMGDQKVALLKPGTYMNLSGRSVQEAAAFYKIEPESILVVCDDFSLPVGKLRIRAQGSDGGQKGLRSIAQCLGTESYPRLRIGIGPVPEQRKPADFVLSRFVGDEVPAIEAQVRRAGQAIEIWVGSGIQESMNRFNGPAEDR